MAHLSYIHHVDEHGSESGQACEDDGYFYLAETDPGFAVQEISVDSSFLVDFKEDSRIIKCNILTTNQPNSYPHTSHILNIPTLVFHWFYKGIVCYRLLYIHLSIYIYTVYTVYMFIVYTMLRM